MKVLIVASTLGYQTRLFAETASRLGLQPVLATDRCGSMDDPWHDHALSLKFHQPAQSARRVEKSLLRVAGVVAMGDKPALSAAHIARRLHLPFHLPKPVEAAGNKDLARRRFARAKLPVPRFFSVPLNADVSEACAHAVFPCVLKPLGLSGSRGVIRAGSPAEFIAAFRRIRRLLELPELLRHRDPSLGFIQVEEYIEGREFALEGLVSAGRLRTLAIFDKPDPLEGPFFEESVYTTPSRHGAAVQESLHHAIQQAVDALGLTQGPIHAEARVNQRGVWVLEVAARPIGGLCARTLRFNNGTPLEEVLLLHAIGQEPAELTLDGPASGAMMIPIPRDGIFEACAGAGQASATAHIEGVEITARPGQLFRQLPERGSYLGFIFARAASAAEAESALRLAHSKLSFSFATTLPVMPRR